MGGTVYLPTFTIHFYLKRTTIHIGNCTVRPHDYPMVGICVLIPAKTKVWRNMLGVQGRREFNAMEQQSPGLYFGIGLVPTPDAPCYIYIYIHIYRYLPI